MSRKIIGVTVGTPLSPNKIKEKLNPEMTSAVNEALAQAKESGEFNGKDYVLTPEDKTEIAEMAADMVPVPEGGGIAVSGATVGQTVKIAAVDENGVPTAWEATDFPSGGGSGGEKPYELIIDSIIPENCERVIFREDLNGNEFEITDFVVWFDGAEGNYGNLTLYLRTHSGYMADNAEQYYYNGPLANIGCRADFNFVFKATKIGVKEWHLLYPANGDSQHISNTRTWVQMNIAESVKQIAIIVANASSGEEYRIVSGTKIKVWGRRV